MSCNDTITEGQILSYIKRELRSLGDVTIDVLGDYRLALVVIELKSTSTGVKTGEIIISSVFMKIHTLSEILNYYVPGIFDRNRAEIAKKIFERDSLPYSYHRYINNLVVYDKTDDLRNACEGIVAKFDTDVLENERQKR